MIKNRPKIHYDLPYYQGLPPPPYQLDMRAIPELIKLALLPLRAIEPLSPDVLEFTGEFVERTSSVEELEFYEREGSDFQIIMVVINSIYSGQIESVSGLLPYSVSLIPASKRGKVEKITAQSVSRLQEVKMIEDGAAYMGLDPFSGEWKFLSDVGLIADMGAKSAMTDELGLVYEHFYLRLDCDLGNVLQAITIDMPEGRLKRYMRHRARLLYTPFTTLKSRQIWGVENALELFVYQEFNRQSLPAPVPQALLFDDGSCQPALYHAWESYVDGSDANLISECDFFFPEKKVAVFCDGGNHSRAHIRERDARIDKSLLDLGIKSIRIKSRDILRNIGESILEVRRAL